MSDNLKVSFLRARFDDPDMPWTRPHVKQLIDQIEELTKQRDEGWNAFYNLRKAVGEERYPGMTRKVRALNGATESAPETKPRQCDCWERISALIVNGTLPGNGTDMTAERNGLILAANTIARDRPAFTPSSEKAGGDSNGT